MFGILTKCVRLWRIGVEFCNKKSVQQLKTENQEIDKYYFLINIFFV